jgi:hypothetical protein
MISQNPILVIDRDGLIGKPLALKLSEKSLVILVSQKIIDQKNQNIIYVPFFKKIPKIPDSKYSYIIFIDEERQDLELLPKIIKKTKEVNSELVFVQGLSAREKEVTSKIVKAYASVKVAIVGDIFDNKIILRKRNSKSTINDYLYQTKKSGKIKVLGDGLREAYSVFLDDVVSRLADIVFGEFKQHSLFYIFPKHLPSELSLAHMIQKSNPEVAIDFVRENLKLRKIEFSANGINLLGDRYPLTKKIREIDMGEIAEERKKKNYKNENKFRKYIFFIFSILILLLLLPFFSTIFFSFIGLNTFSHAKIEMDKGNFANIKSSLRLSQVFYSLEMQSAKIVSYQAKILKIKNSPERFLHDAGLGYNLAESLMQMINAEEYFTKLLNGESKSPIDDFSMGKKCLKNSIIVLNKVRAEEKIPESITQKIKTIDPLINFISNSIDVMPTILGIGGQKTYLVLLQDNTELRPGGGLIDSYGILKFNMGKITEFSLHDIEGADRQLRGHAEPPFAVKKYLPSEHWYMKDSNFDVDFIKSASASANFLFAETGEKVDGVIGVDTTFIKNILHAIGSVYAYNCRITVDENNFYALLQSYVNKSCSSDLTPKGDFLRSVSESTLEKIAKEKENYFLIAQAISKSLLEKHLLLTFKDLQNVFTVNGWSSSLWDERNEAKGDVNDFLGISEANLGINKINQLIYRKISQKVTVGQEGEISEELIVDYKNNNTVSPNGNYKNFLRIILPKDTRLLELSISGNIQNVLSAIANSSIYEAKDYKAPQGLEVEETSEENKTIFGFMVNIPAGEIIKIRFKYALAKNIFGLDAFSYNLKLFKQPGIDNFPFLLSLSYPGSFNIINKTDGTSIGDGDVRYSKEIVKDENIIINFSKK